MSDFQQTKNLNATSLDILKNSNAQHEANRQKYWYMLPVTDDEYRIINQAVGSAKDPQAEAYRWASAIRYSQEWDVPVDQILPNLDTYHKFWTGREFKPDASNYDAIVNSFRSGSESMEQAKLLKQYMDGGGTDQKLWAAIQAKEKEIEALADFVPRNFFVQVLKDGAQAAPFMAKIAGNAAGAYAATGLAVAGTALAAGAYSTGAAAPLGAAVTPEVIAAWAGAGASIAAFFTSLSEMEPLEYYKLRKAGATHDTARTFGFFSAYGQAAVETALGNVAGLLGRLGGRGVTGITEKIVRKMMLSGGVGTAARAFLSYGKEALEEGVEEAVQDLISSGSVAMASVFQEKGIEVPGGDEVLRSAWENGLAGFRAALIIGIPGGTIGAVQDSKRLLQMRKGAEVIGSKEAYIQAFVDQMPEGMTEEGWKATLAEVYDKQQERIATEAPIGENVDIEASDPEYLAPATPERRLATGDLFSRQSETQVQKSDGSVMTRQLYGDPVTGKRYGYVEYTTDRDGAITIEGVKVADGRQALTKEIVQDFASKYPDTPIKWEPKSERLKEIRDQLIEDNPRGDGLTYTTAKETMESQAETAKLNQKLKELMPKMSSRERAAGIELVRLAAAKEGLTADQWIKSRMAPEMITTATKEQMESALAQGKRMRGGVSFKTIEGQTKAIIYATERSDFSTWVHELAHVFRANMTEEQLAVAEQAFGVKDGLWTRKYEERFAKGFEEYLRFGKAQNEELRGLFAQMAAWLQRIYKNIKSRVLVSEDIAKVYDELLGNTESGLAQAETNNRTTTEAAVRQEREAEGVDETVQLYQYIGERSVMSEEEQHSLEEAKKLDEEKVRANDIRLKTGWFKGRYDGKWRKEDTSLEDAELREENGEPVLKAIMRDGSKAYDRISLARIYKQRPSLLKRAPETQDLKIQFTSDLGWARGSFSVAENLVRISDKITDIEEAKKVIAHEVQHSIQYVEGFAKGSTPEQFQQPLMDKHKYNLYSDASILSVMLRGPSAAGDIDKALALFEKRMKREPELGALEAAQDLSTEQIREFRKQYAWRDPMSQYTLTAGEIEARDVAERAGKNYEQIRSNMPRIKELAEERAQLAKKIEQVSDEEQGALFEQEDAIDTELASLGLDPFALSEEDYRKLASGDVEGFAKAPYSTEAISKEEAILLFQTDTDSEEFKNWFGDSKIVDETGKPLIVYHETSQDAILAIEKEGFDLSRLGARKSDEQMPDGVFLKPTSTSIGLGEKAAQLKLYASIQNPLVVESRRNLAAIMEKNEVYAKLKTKLDSVNTEGLKKDEILEKEWLSKIKTDPQAADVILDQQTIALDAWESSVNEIAAQMRMEVTNELITRGHDGLIVKNDTGSFGRKVETIVALRPEQVKSINNRGTWNPQEPSILFQLTEEEILKDAKSFDTWEAWKADVEASAEFLEDQSAKPEGLEGEALDAWYKEKWEQAHKEDAPVDEVAQSEEQRDESFKARMKGDGLTKFLKEIGDALFVDLAGATSEDAENTERSLALQRRIRIEVPPVVQMAAQRVSNGEPLTKARRKAVMTNLERNVRGYRAIYAELTGDKRMEVSEDAFASVKIDEPTAAKWERMSFEERTRYARKVKNQEVARKIASGKLNLDGELTEYIKSLESEEKELQKKITEQNEELSDDLIKLTYADRAVAKLGAQLAEKERELNRYTNEISSRGARIKNWAAKVDTMREKVRELKTEYNEALRSARDEARVQTNVMKAKAIAETKAQIQAKIDERKELERYRGHMIKMAKSIMAKVSDNVDWEYKAKIQAIQAGLDPHFRRALPEWVAEIGEMKLMEYFTESPLEIETLLGKGIMDRLHKRPLNQWTEAELEEVEEKVANLRSDGTMILAAKKMKQRMAADRYQRSIIGSIIDKHGVPKFYATGSAEDKKQKGSLKRKLAAGYYGTIDIKRKAMMLDGDTQGTAYELLVQREREAFSQERNQIDRRKAQVLQALKDKGIKLEDLYETKTVPGAGPEGADGTFSISDLLYVMLAVREVKSRDAVRFGVLCSEDERKTAEDQGEHGRDLLTAKAEARLAKVVNAALTLDPKYHAFAESVAQDFKDEFDRINEVSIREFNQGVNRVGTYVPMHRLEVTGDDLAAAVADDLLNQNGGALPRNAEKGFTIKRITIAPEHQKPIALDLFGSWNRAVDMQEHFIAYAEYGRELNRVFKSMYSGQAKAYITSTFGKEFMQSIDEYINETMNPQSFVRSNDAGKLIRALRGQLAPAYLAWKTSSVLKQLVTSPLPFLQYVNPAEYAAAAAELIAHPIKAWEEIAALSPVMRERKADVMMQLLSEQQKKVTTNKVSHQWKRAQALGMKGLEWADRYTVAGGWLAVYRQQLAKTGDQKLAVQKADDAVAMCQPSGRSVDQSSLFKDGKGVGGEAIRAFTQFQSALNVIWMQLTYDLPTAIKNRETQRYVGIAVSTIVAGVMLGLMSDGFGDDDDEKDKLKKLVYWSFTQGTDAIPLIGEYANALAYGIITGDKKRLMGDDLFPAISKFGAVFPHVQDGDWLKAIDDLGQGIGYSIGAPVSGAKEIGKIFSGNPEALIGRR